MKEPAAASFTGLVDLAAASFGGRALGASDDFFAGVENLIQPGRGVFIPDKYTEHGKWMDGWESRRKRGAGYDFCILELGALGQLLAFDIDTHHFSGNHPPFASIDGVVAEKDTPFAELARLPWRELLHQSPLLPNAQNLFPAEPTGPVTHLRLNIFPDGGVARLRAFGRVHPTWQPSVLDADTQKHVPPHAIDLAALSNGAIALACSDAHFGPMNNLLLPGRSPNMGGGWETRRKRASGHDWILIKLGTRGTVQTLEVDTQHFKGNFPDRCSVEVIDAPAARITDLIQSAAWSALLPKVKLSADTRHFFRVELIEHAAASHLRLNIYPDGGVSRLRVWGNADV